MIYPLRVCDEFTVALGRIELAWQIIFIDPASFQFFVVIMRLSIRSVQ